MKFLKQAGRYGRTAIHHLAPLHLAIDATLLAIVAISQGWTIVGIILGLIAVAIIADYVTRIALYGLNMERI